ncbi:MAG: outer membrane beta-barrel protein [Polyangiaceae bacterium]
MTIAKYSLRSVGAAGFSSLLAFSLALVSPATASAQGPAAAPAPQAAPAGGANCPPGSWFCSDAQVAPAAPPGAPLQPLPGGAPAAQPGVTYQQTPAPPPVVIYQPGPPVMVVAAEAPPPYRYTRRPAARKSEWGLNLHLEGATLGHGRTGTESGMGGAGLGLRYRPVPAAAIEADLDFLGGRDYNGFRRAETAFTLNCLVFVNPKNRAQFYFLGGFGWSGAHATDDSGITAFERQYNYSYFGAQGGIGLEFRAAKHFALNFDALAFVRGRTDENAYYQPEFRDGTRTSNTSGGALFRGGMTFYF